MGNLEGRQLTPSEWRKRGRGVEDCDPGTDSGDDPAQSGSFLYLFMITVPPRAPNTYSLTAVRKNIDGTLVPATLAFPLVTEKARLSGSFESALAAAKYESLTGST